MDMPLNYYRPSTAVLSEVERGKNPVYIFIDKFDGTHTAIIDYEVYSVLLDEDDMFNKGIIGDRE